MANGNGNGKNGKKNGNGKKTGNGNKTTKPVNGNGKKTKADKIRTQIKKYEPQDVKLARKLTQPSFRQKFWKGFKKGISFGLWD
tara:strand:+ start:1341 stop:1592 length:252 start_codon:yes stop_codon:yes gene_type:complete